MASYWQQGIPLELQAGTRPLNPIPLHAVSHATAKA